MFNTVNNRNRTTKTKCVKIVHIEVNCPTRWFLLLLIVSIINPMTEKYSNLVINTTLWYCGTLWYSCVIRIPVIWSWQPGISIGQDGDLDCSAKQLTARFGGGNFFLTLSNKFDNFSSAGCHKRQDWVRRAGERHCSSSFFKKENIFPEFLYKGKDIALICFLIPVPSISGLNPIEDGPAGCSDDGRGENWTEWTIRPDSSKSWSFRGWYYLESIFKWTDKQCRIYI